MTFEVLIDRQSIHEKIRQSIPSIPSPDNFDCYVVVLNGALIFSADFIRAYFEHYQKSLPVYFIRTSSYVGTSSSGYVSITNLTFPTDRSVKKVLLLEDIVDTGKTLDALQKWFKRRNASIYSVCLLDKYECREINIEPDISLFRIPNYFVIGYGLDYNGLYRELPDICIYRTQ